MSSTQQKLKGFLTNPETLKHTLLIFHSIKVNIKEDSISTIPQKFYKFEDLFEETSILSKIYFSEKILHLIDEPYLERLENFLDDLNNPDNLLGEGFQESHVMLSKVSSEKITTKLGHLDAPDDGVVIWIS